jgi:hypothetical protein
MRFRSIEDRRADYPVTIMCDVLGVSPAGHYAWRARSESRRSAANRGLVDDIKRVYRDTSGRYGSPRPGLFATVVADLRSCLSPVGPTQLRKLDASVGASGPHDFAVRCNISRPLAL